MKKVTWISIILFILTWYFFGKFWQNNPNNNFKFSDRDKIMVFPTPKTIILDIENPSTAPSSTPTISTVEIKSSTDASVVKF